IGFQRNIDGGPISYLNFLIQIAYETQYDHCIFVRNRQGILSFQIRSGSPGSPLDNNTHPGQPLTFLVCNSTLNFSVETRVHRLKMAILLHLLILDWVRTSGCGGKSYPRVEEHSRNCHVDQPRKPTADWIAI